MKSQSAKLKNWLWFISLYVAGIIAVGAATYLLKTVIRVAS